MYRIPYLRRSSNVKVVPIVLAVLGGIAALANEGGAVDAFLGALIWFLIGSGIVWIVAKVRKSDAPGE